MVARGWKDQMIKAVAILCAVVALTVGGAARAEAPSGAALVAALRQAGYVLLVRHASSPRTPPTAGEADPENAKLERQLDETGYGTEGHRRNAAASIAVATKSSSARPRQAGRRAPHSERGCGARCRKPTALLRIDDAVLVLVALVDPHPPVEFRDHRWGSSHRLENQSSVEGDRTNEYPLRTRENYPGPPNAASAR